ncbi:MAG TPA: hypothetical protein VEW47_12155 [Candidatus Dormibacteraeota bacterium]|nr:hypothetical protein [Candidatus Dormibacteraeota bacterium]
MTGLERLRSDRAILDCVVLTSATVGFVLAVVPFLWRLYRLPLGSITSTVACFGVAYWGGARLLDRAAGRSIMFAGTLLMQVGAVVTFAWIWHLAGGVDNPAFLWVFAPVLLANVLLLPGWHSYGIAATSWVAVTVVALAESEGLRWLAFRVGLPLAELGDLLKMRRDSEAFTGLSTTPSQIAVSLLLFAGASLTLVCVGDSLARRAGLRARPEDVPNLFRQAVETDPLPRVIVQPGDGGIVHMSESFRRQMLVDRQPANLFEVVRFVEPTDPQLLMSGEEAELLRCRYGIGSEYRVGHLRSHRILQGVEPLVVVTFEEMLLAQSGPPGSAEAAPGRGKASC